MFCGPPATAIGEPGAGTNKGDGEPASLAVSATTASSATNSSRHIDDSSRRAGFLRGETQSGGDPIRPVKPFADRVGRLELVADTPAQIPLDAGRAVVVTVGVVGEPVIDGCAVVNLGE